MSNATYRLYSGVYADVIITFIYLYSRNVFTTCIRVVIAVIACYPQKYINFTLLLHFYPSVTRESNIINQTNVNIPYI
jgi:hypothetical protein